MPCVACRAAALNAHLSLQHSEQDFMLAVSKLQVSNRSAYVRMGLVLAQETQIFRPLVLWGSLSCASSVQRLGKFNLFQSVFLCCVNVSRI